MECGARFALIKNEWFEHFFKTIFHSTDSQSFVKNRNTNRFLMQISVCHRKLWKVEFAPSDSENLEKWVSGENTRLLGNHFPTDVESRESSEKLPNCTKCAHAALQFFDIYVNSIILAGMCRRSSAIIGFGSGCKQMKFNKLCKCLSEYCHVTSRHGTNSYWAPNNNIKQLI